MNKKLIIGIVIIGMLLISPAVYADDLTTDLVSYWKLDEESGTTATDSEGSNDGTANNDRIFTTSVSGILNTGADFSGGDDVITISNSADLFPSEGSLSLWLNANSSVAGDAMYYAGTDSSAGWDYYIIWRTDGELRFAIKDSSGNELAIESNDGVNYMDGNWHHVVATWDGGSITGDGDFSDHIKLYIDGSELSVADGDADTPRYNSGTASPRDSGGNVYFGAQKDDNYYSDTLDEPGLWSRVLSSSEVSDLYNSGGGGAAGSVEITEVAFNPANSTAYSSGTTYNFNATICHDTNVSDITLVNITFDGGEETVTDNTTLNTTCGVWNISYTDLAAGNYSYEWYAEETSGANHTSSGTYEVTKATPTLNLTADPAWSNTWKVETNVTGSGSPALLTYNLYRDGALVSNSDVQNLSAGNYTYVFNTSGNANYSSATTTNTLEINKSDNNNVTLSISPSNSVAYGTETTVGCSDDVGATLTLTRNGLTVTSPDVSTLATGTYDYICAATGHANYTDKNTTGTLTVAEGGEGCTNTTTFTFSTTLNVTHNTTIIDFQGQQNLSNMRSDAQDVSINNGSVQVVDSNRYISFNTTGLIGNVVTISWGNYIASGGYSTGSATPTVTNNITTYSEINNYLRLTFKDEVTLEERHVPDANTTLNLFCAGGQRGITFGNNSNATTILVPSYTDWSSARASVEYSSTDKYNRQILISSAKTSRTMWIVDATTYQMAQTVNEMVDYTGLFPTDETWLEVKTWSGDSLRTVYQSYFDASAYAYFYGIVGNEYQYHIHGPTETRSLGNVIIDTNNLQKVITIRQIVDFDDVEYQGDVQFAVHYNETTGIVTLVYTDLEYNMTPEVNMTIWNTTGSSNEIDSQIYFTQATNVLNDTSQVIFQYLVPNRNATYRLNAEVNHQEAIGVFSFSTLFGGIVAVLTTGISQIYLTLAALTATFSVTFSMSSLNIAFGSIVGIILLGMFASMGWISTPASLIAFVLLGTLIWFMGREVHSP